MRYQLLQADVENLYYKTPEISLLFMNSGSQKQYNDKIIPM